MKRLQSSASPSRARLEGGRRFATGVYQQAMVDRVLVAGLFEWLPSRHQGAHRGVWIRGLLY